MASAADDSSTQQSNVLAISVEGIAGACQVGGGIDLQEDRRSFSTGKYRVRE
jgi:hypothetical protein